jgi:hypothetical protein
MLRDAEVDAGDRCIGLRLSVFTNGLTSSRFPRRTMGICKLQSHIAQGANQNSGSHPPKEELCHSPFYPGCACRLAALFTWFFLFFWVSLRIGVGLLRLTTSAIACLMRRQTYVLLATPVLARGSIVLNSSSHGEEARADDPRSCLAGTQANRAYAPASSLGEEADSPCLCPGSSSLGEETSRRLGSSSRKHRAELQFAW